MKRVTSFLFVSNLTGDTTLLRWLASDVRRFLASSLTVSNRILFQAIGLFIDKREIKADGKGEKSFFTLSIDFTFGSEDLKAVLTSACVEEKLYLKEKCLVPKEFVTTLKNLQEVKSKPSILNDLNQLIQTESEEKK
ncbi:transcription factor bHLH52-like [Senna tora]|uniref:Transcription factor bHLH52-like n=1 Tax=Senna tora TaxID=362788 RepID=A0A834WMS2_9FABA|nr:transcription factor bHLH52-like [Senna tora]